MSDYQQTKDTKRQAVFGTAKSFIQLNKDSSLRVVGDDFPLPPFGPVPSNDLELSPANLSQIAAAVRVAGGTIWHIDAQSFGTLLRAEIGKVQIRLVKLRADHHASEIPHEANSKLLVVSTVAALEQWLVDLLSLKQIKPIPTL